MSVLKKNKWLLFTIVLTLIVAIAFAAVFGTIAAVRNARAVMRYEGLTISKGVYSYFVSYCKTVYLRSLSAAGITASDTAAFFRRDRGDGVNYGDAFAAYAEDYVRTVAVSALLFDSVASLSRTEKQTIRDAVDELVDFRADGDRASFNEQISAYGFTYDDLLTATTLQYKAEHLFTALYGAGGQYVAYDTDACDAYYADAYVYVKMLFIRTENKLATDEDGNHILLNDGTYKTIELTELEKERRAEDIASLDRAIENLTGGSGPVITETMLQTFMDKYGDGDPVYDDTGWYFAADASATQDLASVYPTLTEAALSAAIGSYTKVAYEDGICYIYRMSLPEGGYTDEDVSVFFSDFYLDCASALHRDMLSERTGDVTRTEAFDEIDPVSIPYNTNYFVRLS